MPFSQLATYLRYRWRRYFRSYYSQFGEDILLNELIREDVNDGFFVDVGCFHPKKLSNTYFLYERGWRGINIDVEAQKIALFRMLRPHDCNVVAALSDREEELTLYSFGKYGLESTLDQDFAQQQMAMGKTARTQKLRTQTLNAVIAASPFADRKIDLLSIDAEGMDVRILKSLDFVRHSPEVILVESHARNLDELLKSPIYAFLCEKGYVLCSWAFYTMIFKKPHSPLLRSRES